MPVSKSIAHDSAHKHVSGEAEYIDDLNPFHDQLYVAIGRSSISRGRVTSMDLQGVAESAGVVDVITPGDVPGEIDIGPVFPGDPLLTDQVEFMGQALFAVAAVSHKLARQAVQRAVIEYAEQTPLLDLQKAIDASTYVRPPHRMQRGDADKALASSPHRVHGQITVGGQEHFYLEGQVALAIPEEDGGMTVHSSNQNPTEAQKLLSEVLAQPMHRITVINRRMGGAFGGKETQASAVACFAAIFARRTLRPVSCRLSRVDDMVMTGKRHPFINRYDVGFDDTGKILGIRYLLAADCGCSPDLSDAIVDRAMFHCDNAYFLPNVVVDGLRCKTNKVSNTAFRGFGGPQGIVAAETVIDEIAFYLDKDPVDVRRINFYSLTERNTTHYHQVIDSFTVPVIVDQLEVSSDYRARREEIRTYNEQSPVLKRGIALTPVKFGISFTVTHLNQAGALLHLYSDGSLQLTHGGTEMGQGLMIKVAQVVAMELGVEPDCIQISATRTDKVPNTSPTAASSGTDLNGMAALAAARTIKQRLSGYLAEKYNVSDDEIAFSDGRVAVGKNNSLSFSEVANGAYFARVQLSATGFYKTPDIYYDRDNARGHPFYYFANGAAVAEVIVDTLTGENRLLRVDILHDVGTSINPAIDIGQIEGGFIQGMGWLTTEDLQWNASGKLLSDGPATYKIPAISDTPVEFSVQLLEDTPNSVPTILRSKAVGEPPLMLAVAVHNALRDAIGSVSQRGFPALDIPATPEEILRCVQKVSEAADR